MKTLINMKNSTVYSILTILFVGVFHFSLFAFMSNNVTEDITKAIRNGDSRELARHFGNNVELSVPGIDDTYSKSQAELIMRNFFSNNSPDSFTVNHEGSSRDGSLYVIGVLETKDNKSFRTYFLIKKVSDNYFLHQLQFETQ